MMGDILEGTKVGETVDVICFFWFLWEVGFDRGFLTFSLCWVKVRRRVWL
jgi:hypothetical protein